MVFLRPHHFGSLVMCVVGVNPSTNEAFNFTSWNSLSFLFGVAASSGSGICSLIAIGMSIRIQNSECQSSAEYLVVFVLFPCPGGIIVGSEIQVRSVSAARFIGRDGRRVAGFYVGVGFVLILLGILVIAGDVGGGKGGLIETVVVSCAIGLFFDFVIFHF